MATDPAARATRSAWGRAAGAAIASLLVGGTIWLAGAKEVIDLVVHVEPASIALAFGAAFGSLLCRGLRLSLLLPPKRLAVLPAAPVSAAAQAAALFVPARLGELALPWLLHRQLGFDTASGVATLLAARTLDTAALGIWSIIAIGARGTTQSPLILVGGLALISTLVLIPAMVALIDGWFAPRAARWGDMAARWSDRLHRVRRGLDVVRQRPLRLTGAAAACVASWAFQWTLAWCLLAAMGFRWPAWDVVTGSAVASLSNLLPINLVANIGTLEAGWTAAFTALGVPLETAAATGLATHLWALVIAALFGGAGWFLLGQPENRR